MYKSRQTMSEALKQVAEKSLSKEDKGFSSKQIKQAYGILNDPRYKQGNYDGAYRAIQKIAYGLADHPDVKKAMKRANEEVNVEISDRIIDLLEDYKDLKEFTTSQMAVLKKEYGPLKGKTLSPEQNKKLNQMLGRFDNARLKQLADTDIPMLATAAKSELVIKRGFKWSDFKKSNIEMDFKPEGEQLDENLQLGVVRGMTQRNDHFGARLYIAEKMKDKDMIAIYHGLGIANDNYKNYAGNLPIQLRDKIEKLLYGKIVGKWGTKAGDKIIKEL